MLKRSSIVIKLIARPRCLKNGLCDTTRHHKTYHVTHIRTPTTDNEEIATRNDQSVRFDASKSRHFWENQNSPQRSPVHDQSAIPRVFYLSRHAYAQTSAQSKTNNKHPSCSYRLDINSSRKQVGAHQVAASAVAEVVEHAVAVVLLHAGVDVEARAAKSGDFLGKKLNAIHTVAKNNRLIDVELKNKT